MASSRSKFVWPAAGLILAVASSASQDERLTDQEFTEGVVNKSLRIKGADGKDYGLRLENGGRAVVSLGFNDVGVWKPNGPGGYCVRWNKLPMDQRCAHIVRRDGKLAIMQANGTVAMIEKAE